MLTRITSGGCHFNTRCSSFREPRDLEGWEEKLPGGKQVKMACSFRLTEPAKTKAVLPVKGSGVYGYIKALKESSGADQPFMRLILWFRRYCSHVLEEYGGKEDSSIYKAMFGDTSFMEKDTLDLYRSSGIAHLLAVSGQHLVTDRGNRSLLRRQWEVSVLPGIIGWWFAISWRHIYRLIRVCYPCSPYDLLSVAGSRAGTDSMTVFLP